MNEVLLTCMDLLLTRSSVIQDLLKDDSLLQVIGQMLASSKPDALWRTPQHLFKHGMHKVSTHLSATIKTPS